jgi:hypothetical protein
MSKLKAKWLEYDTESLAGSNSLELHIDTTANTIVKSGLGVKINADTVMTLAGDQTVTGIKTFNSLPQLSISPSGDNDAVRKSYVDGLLTGLTWQDPVYHFDQLVSGATGVGGIRPSAFVDVLDYTGWGEDDAITIDWNDGVVKQAILTAKDTTGGLVTLLNDQFRVDVATSQDLATSIIKCINDSTTTLLAAIQGESQRSVNTAYFIGDNPAAWTQFNITVTGPAGSAYRTSVNTDLGNPNLGKLYASLISNETHFARGNDNGYTWDDDGNRWVQISGVGSLPDATKSQHGVIMLNNGLYSPGNDGDVMIDIYATDSGLEFAGISPNGQLRVAAAGIKDTHIAWGLNTGEVSAEDMPIRDATALYNASTVEDALVEAMLAINSNGAGLSALEGRVTSAEGNITNLQGDVLDLENNVIEAGNGLVIVVGGTLHDSTTQIAIDLAANPGLEFVDGNLTAKVDTAKGLKLTASGIAIELQSLGGLLFDSTGAIYVDPSSVTVENKVVEVVTLDSTAAMAMFINLVNVPTTASAVEVSISTGIQQEYGKDYTVVGKSVIWDSGAPGGPTVGLTLVATDVLIISYTC